MIFNAYSLLCQMIAQASFILVALSQRQSNQFEISMDL